MRGDLLAAGQEARIARSHYSKQGLWPVRFRLLEAESLVSRGTNEDAISVLTFDIPQDQTDLQIKKDLLLAIAQLRAGNSPVAEQHLLAAEQAAQRTSSPLAGEVARARGVIEVDRDNMSGSEAAFRRSLQFARNHAQGYLEATALLNLGIVAMKGDHYEEAIDWWKKCYERTRALGYHLTQQKALGSLAWAYYKTGDYEKSLSSFQEAIATARTLGAVKDEAMWLSAMGVVHYDTGQLDLAEQKYREVLSATRKMQNHPGTIDALTMLSAVLTKEKRYDEAISLNEQAAGMARADGNRTQELEALLVQGLISSRQNDFGRAEQIFREVATDPKTYISLKWEAEKDLATVYENQRRTAEAGAMYRRALATFAGARSSLRYEDSKLPFLANATRIYDSYIHFLIGQGRASEALALADDSRARNLTDGLGLGSFARSFASTNLNAPGLARTVNATLLFYWLGEEQSYLWAVTHDGISHFTLPPAAEISPLVQSYRKALVGPRDALASANASGIKLYDVLVAPAQKLIPRDSRVIVLADGDLNNLNFETLLASSPKLHYWIDDVTIVNASSMRLLRSNRRHTSLEGGKLLLMGNAEMSNPDYPELPKAADEIANIEKHFPADERRVYQRSQATPEAYVRSNPEQYSFIHFVAHGTASRLSPLDSAVVLSKSTGEEDSFKLYAREVIRQPLKAELVTISTCYGAGSRAYTGEGLVGLSWSFLRAGAHNVVGALWEVSDTATPQLMDSFYRRLRAGKSPDEALRAAKLEMLHSQGVFRKPFYWAPFQLYTGA